MTKRTTPTATELEASLWIVRLETPDATAEDVRAFQAWLAADDAHKRAYEALGRTWDLLDTLKRPAEQAIALPPAPARRFGRPELYAAIAAVAVLVLGLGAWRTFHHAPVANGPAYATSIGQQDTIILSDGSVMQLSAGTKVRTAFSANERRVILDEGVVLFAARSDDQRPFIIQTRFGVLHTDHAELVVRTSSRDVRATILEGVVDGSRPPSPLNWLAGHRNADRLSARGQQELCFTPSAVDIVDATPQVVARRLAWIQGMLALDGEPLHDATDEIFRQTGTRFTFHDPAIGDLRVGGYLPATDVDGFLSLLRTNLHLEARRISPDQIELSHAKPASP